MSEMSLSNLSLHNNDNLQSNKSEYNNSQSTASFQIILKNPHQGVAIAPKGSYEFKDLLQQYMLMPLIKTRHNKALLVAPNVANNEVKFIIQTLPPTTVPDICRVSLESSISRFSQIKQAWQQFVITNRNNSSG